MTSDAPDPSSLVDGELEKELDSFISLQQQIQNPNTLTTYHLSQTMISSGSSDPASTTEEIGAHRVF